MSVFSRLAIFNGRNGIGFTSNLTFAAGEFISQLYGIPLGVLTSTRPIHPPASASAIINLMPFGSGAGFLSSGLNVDSSGQLYQIDTDDLESTPFLAVIMKPS